MSHHRPCLEHAFLTRRELLRRGGMGFGLVGLAGLLAERMTSVEAAKAGAIDLNPLAPRQRRTSRAGQAGRPSVHERWALARRYLRPQTAARSVPRQAAAQAQPRTERKTGAAMRSPFTFRKYGQSGIEVSELFAQTAEHIDDICVIRSMHADVPNHEPSLMLMNCGDGRLQRPSLGSWITYGLGSENQNLPGFIVMCPGGYPIVATQNWRSAFLPGAYQGTYINTQNTDVDKLIENIRNTSATPEEQRKQLDLVRRLNESHLERRQHDAHLEARIQSLELAFRMQAEASRRLRHPEGAAGDPRPLRLRDPRPPVDGDTETARARSSLHPGLEWCESALG